jgi:hypothetical protein
VRDHDLMLACIRLGLEPSLGRGFDELPPDIRKRASLSLVGSLISDELLRALRVAVDALLSEASGVHDEAAKLDAMLRELASAAPD